MPIGSMNSTEGAAATEENPGYLLAPESSSNNSHKPLHHTRSEPQFLCEEKRIRDLQVEEFEGRRSRSHSEPLTREAIKIAQELRKVSDLFNTNYELVSSPTTKREFNSYRKEKSRRVTVAGSGGESLRQELNQVLRAHGDFSTFDPIPLPPEGTPV